MKEIKAEPYFMWECPYCHEENYVPPDVFSGEKHEKDYVMDTCRRCETKQKVIKE